MCSNIGIGPLYTAVRALTLDNKSEVSFDSGSLDPEMRAFCGVAITFDRIVIVELGTTPHYFSSFTLKSRSVLIAAAEQAFLASVELDPEEGPSGQQTGYSEAFSEVFVEPNWLDRDLHLNFDYGSYF